MKPTLSIHGSCVSRDLAEFHGYTVLNYQARSSLCTKGTEPCDYAPSALGSISSNFQRRMVEWDLKKRPFISGDSDLILLDLIDERFDVYSNGNTGITRSNASVHSSILKSLKGNFQRVNRGTEDYYEMFRAGLEKFQDYVCKPLIFHDARWATCYSDSGRIVEFNNQDLIRSQNQILERLSQIVRKEISPTLIVEAGDLCIGDINHKWGPESFHYIPEYYASIDKQIMANLNNLLSE